MPQQAEIPMRESGRSALHFVTFNTLEAIPRHAAPAFATILLFAFTYYVYFDYQAYLSLGPGGNSQDFSSYASQVFLRLVIIRNPTTPGPVPAHLRNAGYLRPQSLPKRPHERPKIAGIAPQRQLTQKSSPEVFTLLSERIRALAHSNPKSLRLGTSCFEKHSTGLFSVAPFNITCKGEIVHAHPSDGSMHLTLHPADAKTVIEAGWGERHPLSKGGWCKRFVPAGFTMVYAPSCEAEVDVALDIIEAGWQWVNGAEENTKSGKDDQVSCMEYSRNQSAKSVMGA